jgi:ABC-type lipoprotein export system ATPase subunit
MLEQSNALADYSLPQKTILMTLAGRFQSQTDYLFLNPEELQQETSLGSIEQWYALLNLQETKNYIKGQMAFLSQIAQRKTFKELVEMALDGNHQAAKQVQELSGVLNQQDSNRVVVLHRIPRPEQGVQ